MEDYELPIPAHDLPDLGPEYEGVHVAVVGGWVRDYSDEAVPADEDLVVMGETPESMREHGFIEAYSEQTETFNVFVDSQQREVALARTETSTGNGYHDFTVEPIVPDVSPEQALREDLRRRDFTVNSMAVWVQAPDSDAAPGELVDPHDGREDLQTGTLRATSEQSFAHDPLRVLRGARFAASHHLELTNRTCELMREAAANLDRLPNERIRMEIEKTFKTTSQPSVFFATLDTVLSPASRPDPILDWRIGLDDLAKSGRIGRAIKRREHDAELTGFTALGTFTSPHQAAQLADHLMCSFEQRRALLDGADYVHELRRGLNSTHLLLARDETLSLDRVVDVAASIQDTRPETNPFDEERAREMVAAADAAVENVTGKDLIEAGYDPDELGAEFGLKLRRARAAYMDAVAGAFASVHTDSEVWARVSGES